MRVLKIAVATLLLLAVQAPYAVNTAAAGIFTVDSTADTTDANAGDGVCDDGAGNCTLRAAIQEANAFAGTDTIGFNLTSTDPGYVSTTASWRISPGSPLPTTTAPIVIDGYTQPGSAEATSSTVATLKIELDGSGAGSFSIGLAIVGGSTVVKGLVINQFGRAGIRIVGNNGNIVDGNFIGTSIDGSSPLGNGTGILIHESSDHLVGGPSVERRNIISGNEYTGVSISGGGSRNRIRGNYIGTDVLGVAAIPNGEGVVVFESSGNTVGGTSADSRNIISGNQYIGVGIQGGVAENNLIQGNFIGVDVSGVSPLGNGQNGVEISHVDNNTIGGTVPGARNIISSNGQSDDDLIPLQDINGLMIDGGEGNVVQGTYIGTDVTGTAILSNVNVGIYIQSSSYNLIGGAVPGAGNLISGNASTGVRFDDTPGGGGVIEPENNTVQGNLIGTDFTGTTALGNGDSGIAIAEGELNEIGGLSAGSGNTIAFNAGHGINVFNPFASGNTIRGNRIFQNGALGINLSPSGVTPNDPDDIDTGANNLQNYPVLIRATSASSTVIEGTLDSVPDSQFQLDFFSNTACDPSGYGEGETYLGSTEVTTDANGDAIFVASLAAVVSAGQFITATATDEANNTSEFSQCITAVEQFTYTVTSVADGGDSDVGDGLCDNGSGDCTLRAAIEEANATTEASLIQFDIPGAGPHTIQPGIPLPEITEPLVIDGYTQPGASPNTSTTSSNAVLKIELDGTNAIPTADGLVVKASNTTVKGLVVNRFPQFGIQFTFEPDLSQTSNNAVRGSFIGTNVSGTTALANGWGVIIGFSHLASVGGPDPADRNVISGNTGPGVSIGGAGASSATVQGNLIGTAADGVTPLARIHRRTPMDGVRTAEGGG